VPAAQAGQCPAGQARILAELAEPRTESERETALDLYVRSAAAEINSWKEKVVRDLKGGGALVLHVAPKKLTPALVNRYLEIKARQLL